MSDTTTRGPATGGPVAPGPVGEPGWGSAPPADGHVPPAPPPTHPLLRRSTDDKVVAGVCGGIGRYLGVDPVVVRVATVILALATGAGLLAYVVAWIVIPEDDGTAAAHPHDPSTGQRAVQAGTAVFGLVLVAVGGALLVGQVAPWLDQYVWPALLIAVGVGALLVGSRR